MASGKKNAAKEGRTIVFIDESGLSERPHRRRTWGRRGKTPVLQYHFAWGTLSAIAGVTWRNFYFQLHRGSIKGAEIVKSSLYYASLNNAEHSAALAMNRYRDQ